MTGEKGTEYQSLPPSGSEIDAHNETSRAQKRIRSAYLGFLALFLATLAWNLLDIQQWLPAGFPKPCHARKGPGAPTCHQVPALLPDRQTVELINMDAYLETNDFRNTSIERLSGAVKIPTESFDDLGSIGEDKRWEVMYDFAVYLKETFPKVHEALSLENVNTHGLLFTWKGTDEKLKPTLLMAHQDVVPVPKSTADTWAHPAFSGFYDGKYVWGRGASDCKNQLIGIMEAVEELIKADFKPHRTVLLPFGFDEEVSGPQGAGHLAPFLVDRYGHDGIAVIVDEGATFNRPWGVQMALPGVAEKGATDVHIIIRMPGGHSSIPSPHTSIGVMSELITHIEGSPYPTHLDDQNPYLGLLTCGAEHAPNFPSKMKKLLHHRFKAHNSKPKKDHLALEAAKAGPPIRYLMQTSVAADVINGGVKVNALPERTTAIINHRINIGESAATVHHKITNLAKAVADKHNLTLHAFDGSKEESPSSITLSSGPYELEPAPVTPTENSILSPWAVLSGTTRALYGEDVIVAPGIMTGNTDTRYYWKLSKHIFRFSAGWDGESSGLGNIHTVDEKISVKSHVNMVRWMSLFVRNMDQSGLE